MRRRRPKIVILGAAPGPTSDPNRPLSADSESGARLLVWLGLTEDEARDLVVRMNVLDEWPGRAQDGSWSAFACTSAKVREAAADVLRRRVGRRPVLMLGRSVATACRVPRSTSLTLLRWVEVDGRIVAVLPHPSRKNRSLNDRSLEQRTIQFCRELVDAARSLQ